MTAFKPLVFSGVQPTGNLHLGNYLGAIKKFVALQDTSDCIYCVVDLHSLTAQLVHDDLADQTRSITAAFLASGIDPKKHIVFNQSRVMQHAELAWIFNCVARIGWMNRMTQFKDKAGKDRENASLGLLAYPSLMAADILLYRATHVPVGEDQKQHLELTRDIAQKFNNDFSDRIAALGVGVEMQVGEETVNGYFPMTEPVIGGPAARIMSLRDGSKKMSKSDPSDLSRINLTDDADTISKKIRKAKTDPEALPSEVDGLDGRPGGGKPGRHLCRPRRHVEGGRAEGIRRPAVFGVQAGAGRSCRRQAGADRRRDAPHRRRPRLCRRGAEGRRRTRRRAGRDPR